MQAPTSITTVGAIVGLFLLGLALLVYAPALLAIPFFLVAFVLFLIRRGRRRADVTLSQRFDDRVPSTQEAAADPAGDSGVRDAARSRGHAA
jgi:hypothetical protein